MGTMTIELKNEHAAKLLRDLEEMDLLKIISEEGIGVEKQQRLSEKYWGILSAKQGADLDRHIAQIRNEWE